MYKEQELGSQRLDLVVDDKLVVEAKATADLHKAATRQLYNYLRATNLRVGLLLHFGPEPRFFRIICPTKEKIRSISLDQKHPRSKLSVWVASDPQAVTNDETAGGPEPSPSSCLKNT